MKINPKDYRPNVGMMIINQNKEIFVGKRIDHPSEFWQMPQGGIDPKEKSEMAALREMEEEVGIKPDVVVPRAELNVIDNNFTFRESDYREALDNETNEESEEEESTDDILERDYQLSRAIDAVKTIAVLN